MMVTTITTVVTTTHSNKATTTRLTIPANLPRPSIPGGGELIVVLVSSEVLGASTVGVGRWVATESVLAKATKLFSMQM
jgi:hypothetical protein